jgi:N-carbamoylputrescine amidase
MNTRKLTVGLIQLRCSAEPERNLTAVIEGIRKAVTRGARLILLPELHNSPYFCQTEDADNFDLAETIPGPTTERLGGIAAELGVVIVASIFEKRAAGLYHNTAVALDSDGRIAGRYRKMHIPDDPGYYEKFYFTPGDLGFTPVPTAVGTLGILVCWDQWYPEAARLMALGGAQILLYPTAIGWDPGDADDEKLRQREAWLTIQRAHAIANGLPVLSCNRTGFEADASGHTRGIEFWGSSAVFGPQGEVIEQATEHEAGIIIATLDLQRTEQVRRLWPYLRDRRIDAYQGLLRRFCD